MMDVRGRRAQARLALELARHSLRPASRPGPDVCPMHLGEPDFSTPAFIRRALAEALEQGYTGYAQPQGDPELRATLAADISGRAAGRYESAQVIVTAGGSPAINAAIMATVDAGDRVVIPEPTYSLYADAVRMAGGSPVFVPPGPDLRLDLAAIGAAAVGARMLILCNPNNPTGVVHRPDELGRLSEIAAERDLLVLADEAYDHIVFDGRPFVSTLELGRLYGRLIYCQTFSKTFAMTGFRIGYVAAPADIAPAVGLIHRTFNGPVNSAVQRAALTALTTESSWPEERCQDYQRRRDAVVSALAGVPGLTLTVPEGAFYAFPRYAAPLTDRQLVDLALERGVGLRLGTEFGASGAQHVRLAYCVEDARLEWGLRRLADLFRSLDGG